MGKALSEKQPKSCAHGDSELAKYILVSYVVIKFFNKLIHVVVHLFIML